MPIRIFNDFERPSSADFNRYFMQQAFVVKPSNEIVNNSGTLQPDDHLFLPVRANSTYWVLGLIFFDATSTADFRLGWDGPPGSTFSWGFDGMPNSAGSYISTVSRSINGFTNQPVSAGVAVNTIGTCIPKGLLRTAGSSGNFLFRFSQGTAEVSNCTVRANSLVIVRRMTS